MDTGSRRRAAAARPPWAPPGGSTASAASAQARAPRPTCCLCGWLERVLQKCAVRHYGAAATTPPRVEAGLLLGLPGFSRRLGRICCALGDLQRRATASGVGRLALDRCAAAIRGPQRADRAVQMSSSPKPRLGAHPARSGVAASGGLGISSLSALRLPRSNSGDRLLKGRRAVLGEGMAQRGVLPASAAAHGWSLSAAPASPADRNRAATQGYIQRRGMVLHVSLQPISAAERRPRGDGKVERSGVAEQHSGRGVGNGRSLRDYGATLAA